MTTLVALDSISAVAWAVISRCSPYSVSAPEGAAMPNPPAITEMKDRFMALHMM